MKLTRKSHTTFPIVFFSISLLLASGCVRDTVALKENIFSERPVRITPPTVQDLVAKLEKESAGTQSLKAAVDLYFFTQNPPKSTHCKGHLAYEKGGDLYLKGFGGLTTSFFTLVAKGGIFWLHLPKQNIAYTGPTSAIKRADFELEVGPEDFDRALIPQPIARTTDTVNLESDQNKRYVLTIFTALGQGRFLSRKIWFDPYRWDPVEEIYYAPQGFPELEIFRRDFRELKAGAYPQSISIRKSELGFVTTIQFRELEINSTIDPKRFELEVPEDTLVEKLGEK